MSCNVAIQLKLENSKSDFSNTRLFEINGAHWIQKRGYIYELFDIKTYVLDAHPNHMNDREIDNNISPYNSNY